MKQDHRPKRDFGTTDIDKPALRDRRGFLKLTGAGLAAGGAALAPAAAAADGLEPAGAERRGDYHETEHIRTYYRLAR